MVGEFLVRSIITISYVKLREDREGKRRRGGERVREGIKEEGGGGQSKSRETQTGRVSGWTIS